MFKLRNVSLYLQHYPLNIKYYSKNVITRSLLIFLHIKTYFHNVIQFIHFHLSENKTNKEV